MLFPTGRIIDSLNLAVNVITELIFLTCWKFYFGKYDWIEQIRASRSERVRRAEHRAEERRSLKCPIAVRYLMVRIAAISKGLTKVGQSALRRRITLELFPGKFIGAGHS